MSKLLIVDDDKVNRLRLAQTAQSLGFTTILASDGLKALSVLEDNPDIACLLTDCQMPNLDGPALIGKIRSEGKTLPILVYSAYRTVKEISDLIEKGATGFLRYPVTRENLDEYLHRYLFQA